MNKNFFCKKPFINLYKKNNKNSEIVSQIIYGEKLRLINKKSGWLYVKNTYDNYKGYIENILLWNRAFTQNDVNTYLNEEIRSVNP